MIIPEKASTLEVQHTARREGGHLQKGNGTKIACGS